MTNLKVTPLFIYITTFFPHYALTGYCLYDPEQFNFLSDGRKIRNYATADGARGALSRVNHGKLPDKRK